MENKQLSVSILIPTHKEYTGHKGDLITLNDAVKAAAEKLHSQYPQVAEQINEKINEKINAVLKTIDSKHLKEGLALYANSSEAYIYYLPFHVNERIIIDYSFEVRDMIYAAKQLSEYVVLVLSENENKLFYGMNDALTELKVDELPENILTVKNEGHSKVGNFTTSDQKHEDNLEKYVRKIDKAIVNDVLSFGAPLIVCGPIKLVSLYKSISELKKNIAGEVHGNHERSNTTELYAKILPILDLLQTNKQTSALNILGEAIGKDTYATGIEPVLKAINEKNARLLLVEKGFYLNAKINNNQLVVQGENINEATVDAIDDIIEMALACGCNVEFVENGQLNKYQKIALVTRY